MRKQQRQKIIFWMGVSVMVLFLSGMAYLIIFNDPITEQEYDTGNPDTTLLVRTHTLTGEKEYIYGVTDGVGGTEKNNP